MVFVAFFYPSVWLQLDPLSVLEEHSSKQLLGVRRMICVNLHRADGMQRS